MAVRNMNYNTSCKNSFEPAIRWDNIFELLHSWVVERDERSQVAFVGTIAFACLARKLPANNKVPRSIGESEAHTPRHVLEE